MKGYLLFGDGGRHDGTLIGARQATVGELVFNTSMTGYQEILTDPSYHRQIVTLTHPEIGNYGCHDDADESNLGRAAGMVFRDLSPGVWHYRQKRTFDDFLASLQVTAITGVDTRAVVHKIRDQGAANVIIAPAEYPLERAQAELAAAPPMIGANLAPDVSTRQPLTHGDGETHIALLDFGIKRSTIRALTERGCKVTQLPWNTSLAAITALKPDGVLLSNGPGDPDAVPGAPALIAELIDRWPVMGICLGFQIMALALGGKTYKLPFGHHGGNHPVKCGDRALITAQNHGFAVDAGSLDPERVELTHHSLFDQSLEGFRLRDRPAFGVQFHPEAGPGPNDCMERFDFFLSLVKEHA